MNDGRKGIRMDKHTCSVIRRAFGQSMERTVAGILGRGAGVVKDALSPPCPMLRNLPDKEFIVIPNVLYTAYLQAYGRNCRTALMSVLMARIWEAYPAVYLEIWKTAPIKLSRRDDHDRHIALHLKSAAVWLRRRNRRLMWQRMRERRERRAARLAQKQATQQATANE